MNNDRRRREPMKLAEMLIEGFAALIIFVGCGATTLIAIGILCRVVVWAWSW